MAARVGARLRDGFFGLGSFGVLLTGVATISGDCRRYLFDALQGQLPPIPDLPFQHLLRDIGQVVPIGGPAALSFGAAAVVLFILMFRA